jgi:hypothetical protein
MQRQTYEFVDVSGGKYQLPITLKQSNPKLSRLPGLVLMTALAAIIVLPQIALAAYAVASSEVRSALIDQPLVALQLAAALALWVALVCWPLRNILMSLLSDRLVDIRNGDVTVIDKTPFSTVTWQMPLATYEGVALHIRSSLSGIRHEAILVHPNRSRSVILMVAQCIGEREILEVCRVLQLPNIPADRLYGLGPPPPPRKIADDLAAPIV